MGFEANRNGDRNQAERDRQMQGTKPPCVVRIGETVFLLTTQNEIDERKPYGKPGRDVLVDPFKNQIALQKISYGVGEREKERNQSREGGLGARFPHDHRSDRENRTEKRRKG